jgi:hypothetical protein
MEVGHGSHVDVQSTTLYTLQLEWRCIYTRGGLFEDLEIVRHFIQPMVYRNEDQ